MRQVSFDQVGSVMATFLCAGGVTEGQSVDVGINDSVTLCGDGKGFCGVTAGVSGDGFAAVQLRGAVAVGYSGGALTVGWKNLCGDGKGGVRPAAAGETGRGCGVLSVDTAANTAVIFL